MRSGLEKLPGYKLFEKFHQYIPFENPRPFIYAYILFNASFVVVISFLLEVAWFTVLAIMGASVYVWFYHKALSNWKKYDEMKERLEIDIQSKGEEYPLGDE